ncbi:MAG: ATP-binding protein [Burkholderiales bacterium]
MQLRLYFRIWLAVVLAVAVLIFLVGLAWRLSADPPLRDAVVRDATGQIVGRGHSLRSARQADRSDRTERDEQAAGRRPGGAADPAGADEREAPSRFIVPGDHPDPAGWGPGPAFVIQMDDGQLHYVHLPRPVGRSFWNRPPFGFFWTLALVGIGVALATYPIVRKLTRSLERLHTSVEQWGAGDLSARAPVVGNDEAAFLARRFNHAAERIETLVASHKSLLANASHELRSPLARIRMGLELMGDKPSPALKSELARNVTELDQLIDEILLASRLDAREADVGTIEAVDLVGIAAEECARTGAELDAGEAEVMVSGVARLLRRAVRNLLENARRYGRGEVELTLRRHAGEVLITVSDRGAGVPPSERERIFEPFYRAAGASEREGGVGLGLALVKSIAERHGGKVRCEERPGGGASFVLELPVAS